MDSKLEEIDGTFFLQFPSLGAATKEKQRVTKKLSIIRLPFAMNARYIIVRINGT